MNPDVIEPGQRYARRRDSQASWEVKESVIDTVPAGRVGDVVLHPIIEPPQLPEVKVGSTVLNVATGEQFEWRRGHREGGGLVPSLTPLLALVSTTKQQTTSR